MAHTIYDFAVLIDLSELPAGIGRIAAVNHQIVDDHADLSLDPKSIFGKHGRQHGRLIIGEADTIKYMLPKLFL